MLFIWASEACGVSDATGQQKTFIFVGFFLPKKAYHLESDSLLGTGKVINNECYLWDFQP